VTGGIACIIGAFVTARVYPELPGYQTHAETVG
jgi:hypothetical protein